MNQDNSLVDVPDEELASILPLICLAWADGVLTSNEIGRVRHHVARLSDGLGKSRNQVEALLDPDNPPDASTYQRWLDSLRRASSQLPEDARNSISSLGAAFADVADPNRTANERAKTLEVLTEIEQALGVQSNEILSDLLVSKRISDVAEASTPAVPRLEPSRLGAWLDGEHAAHKRFLRDLLQTEQFARYEGYDTHEYRTIVTRWLRQLASEGLGKTAFPVEYGGEGDAAKFIATFETLSFHDLSLTVKYGVQFGLFGGSIHQLGSESHHEKYLRRIGEMTLPGCFAMSELGHGSNVREVETTATFDADRDGFIISTPMMSSRKEWIGNAAVDGMAATVFAQLVIDGREYGVHAFVVPIRSSDGAPLPGIRIEDCGHKMGLNGVDNGRISFDDVWVERDALLDRFASVSAGGDYTSPIPSPGKRFFSMLGTLVGGRISVGFGGLSAAKSGLAIAIRYANRRRQFGPKDKPESHLLDYLSHQRKLLPPLATTYALHIALSELRRMYSTSTASETEQDTIESLASGLKAYSTWHTTQTLQTAREACGGQGFLTANRLATLKEDTDVFTTFEGDNTVLMLQVAKTRLSFFRQQFGDLNFFGILKYLGEQASHRFTDSNPIVARKADPAHLRSTWFHRNAMGFRSEKLLRSVAARLKGRIEDGMSSFDAFIECQDHLLTMSEAYIEEHLVRMFRRAILAEEDEDLAALLRRVYELFALSVIEKRSGWFLEQDYISGSKSKAIRKEVNKLCDELRPDAELLVDGFLIPDKLLAAPIAFDGLPA